MVLLILVPESLKPDPYENVFDSRGVYKQKTKMPEKMPGENIADENIEDNKEDLMARVKLLRELLNAEELLQVRTDDNFMLRYLRCCEYDPEAAFTKVIEKGIL